MATAATSPLSWAPPCSPSLRVRPAAAMLVQAQKKARKTRKIILKEDVSELGKKGQLLEVKMGFFRNYLFPLGKAQIVTPILLK